MNKQERKRGYNLKQRYGITIDEANEMLDKGCEVCGSFDRLHIDHSHETGLVRGCLCHKCNTALGLLDEDPDKMVHLISYIRSHK